jgi:hypothetical protein
MKKIQVLINITLVVLTLLLSFSCNYSTDEVVVLYYSDPQGMYLIPISTTMKLNNLDNITKPKQITPILEEIKISRGDKNLRACVPPGVSFSEIEIHRDKKEIDLTINSEKKRLGDTDEQLMIGAIVNTLTELKGFSSVKINPGNLQSDIDFSNPFSKDEWKNLWFIDGELDEKKSLANVYWLTKNRKYLVPIVLPILKNDVTSLLKVLKAGPQGTRKDYLENSIPSSLGIIIKAVNLNHIDIELKSKQELSRSIYEDSKKAVLLTISDLNVFDTVKFITPYSNEEIIDLKKTEPLKEINRIEFFVGGAKE